MPTEHSTVRVQECNSGGEDGDLIAGHGRLAAARRLGLKELPVIILDGLTDLQKRQLMLADNRIALNAGWDIEVLRLELNDLAALGRTSRYSALRSR